MPAGITSAAVCENGLKLVPPAKADCHAIVATALFPANTRGAILRFWLLYWFWFFALLPWMLLRQLGVSLHRLLGALWTWNRCFDFLDGRLRLLFVNSLPALAVTAVFGERFTAIHYYDVLIRPDPARWLVYLWIALGYATPARCSPAGDSKRT